jgi:hypothetical protein
MKTMNNLSDRELLNRFEQLVRKEHDVTLEILPHLLEVEQRKLYLELGYPSIYRYCRKRLNYSESSTNRRLAASCAYQRSARGWPRPAPINVQRGAGRRPLLPAVSKGLRASRPA